MSIANEVVYPNGHALARFVTGTNSLDPQVVARVVEVLSDGVGTLIAAANSAFPTGARITRMVRGLGGNPQASVVGGGFKTSMVNAALVNGTMGYACDLEPHHPEAILHPIAVVLPVALAVGESRGASGGAVVEAVAIGCEVEYRLSMALGPGEQYDLGFHPSAVCGAFGAAAAAARLLGLDTDAVERAFGLAACQASGLMAWESEPTENARPFQMGMAARNGTTAALLAGQGFGGPRNVFDSGHTVFKAFSRNPAPERLTSDLGVTWNGITALAIKPYSSVAFLHPALDALFELMDERGIDARDIRRITMRFSKTGVHCVDGNPLKSHCAQYILAVAAVNGVLDVSDLFFDRRENNRDIADLSSRIDVEVDDELEKLFPDFYATVLRVETTTGTVHERRKDIARGYPQSPMGPAELRGKFENLVTRVTTPAHCDAVLCAIARIDSMPDVGELGELLRVLPRHTSERVA